MLTTAWMIDLLVFGVGVTVSDFWKTFFKLFFPYNYGPVHQWCNVIFIYLPHNAVRTEPVVVVGAGTLYPVEVW